MSRRLPVASVVIPAHNEENGIRRCLDHLRTGAAEGNELEIVVVANGCTDATVRVARDAGRNLRHFSVVDLTAASKSRALNAGDDRATVFPRIYLDADITLDSAALDGLVRSLTTDQARVAAPTVRFDLQGASRVVRMFYDVYTHTPYVKQGLTGLGVYGVSAAGRRRFEVFPDMIADDLFVQRLFSSSERVSSPGTFVVRVPRTVTALLRVRSRTAQGNAELAATSIDRMPGAGHVDTTRTSGGTLRALIAQLVRRPRSMPALVVYIVVTVLARIRARRIATDTWLRDDSTRAAPTPSRTEEADR